MSSSRLTASAQAARFASPRSRPFSRPRQRLCPQEGSRRTSGHERPLPGEHPERRYIFRGSPGRRWGNDARNQLSRSAWSPRNTASIRRSPEDNGSICWGAPRPITAHLARAHPGGVRVGPCLWQGVSHGQVVRRQHVVPLRSSRSVAVAVRFENQSKGIRGPHKLKGACRGARANAPKPRGKIRRDRDGERVQPVRRREQRDETAARALLRGRSGRGDARSVPRSVLHVLREHRRSIPANGGVAQQARGRHRLFEERPRRGLARRLRGAKEGDVHVVDTYQCEWKTTLDDPERLETAGCALLCPVARALHMLGGGLPSADRLRPARTDHRRPARAARCRQLRRARGCPRAAGCDGEESGGRRGSCPGSWSAQIAGRALYLHRLIRPAAPLRHVQAPPGCHESRRYHPRAAPWPGPVGDQ